MYGQLHTRMHLTLAVTGHPDRLQPLLEHNATHRTSHGDADHDAPQQEEHENLLFGAAHQQPRDTAKPNTAAVLEWVLSGTEAR